MAENSQPYLHHSLPHRAPGVPSAGFSGHKGALALGIGAALVAALFVCAPWSVAPLAALAILALSAAESEPFLLLVIFLLPLNWVLKTELPVRDVMMVVRVVVVVGFFVGRMSRREINVRGLLRPSLTRASIFFGAVAVASVALPTGGWTHESVRELSRLASYLGFYLLILAWVNSVERIRRVGVLLLVSTIVVALFAVFQEIIGGFTFLWFYFNPPDEYFIPWSNRAPSSFAYSNVLSGYLNLILPFALACHVLAKGKWKKLGAWTLGLGFMALLCTQSLGGLTAFGSVLVLAIFCFVRGWNRRLLLLVGLCISAFGFYIARETLNPAHAGSTFVYDSASRLVMWGAAWDLFVHSPIVGVGWGNFVGSRAADLHFGSWMPPQVLYANNLYLDLLAGAGVLGFVSFSVLAFLGLRQAQRAMRSSSDFFDQALGFGVLGAIVASLVHGFVDDVIVVSPQAGTVLWIMLALLVANASGIVPVNRLAPSPQNVRPAGEVAFRA